MGISVRKFLAILGGISAAVLILLAVGIGVVAWNGTALDKDSRSYVDVAVPAIVAHWSPDELLRRATPELRASAKPDQVESLFDRSSFLLGTMVQYDGATGQAVMSYFSGKGSIVSARYVAKVRFEKGEAAFQITLTKRDGRWLINGFYIQPAQNLASDRRA